MLIDSPHAMGVTAHGASVIQIESSKLVPWLILITIMASTGLVGSLFCFSQLAITQREARLLDNDWQQMNAFLARQGVVKDENGFYVIGKEK